MREYLQKWWEYPKQTVKQAPFRATRRKDGSRRWPFRTAYLNKTSIVVRWFCREKPSWAVQLVADAESDNLKCAHGGCSITCARRRHQIRVFGPWRRRSDMRGESVRIGRRLRWIRQSWRKAINPLEGGGAAERLKASHVTITVHPMISVDDFLVAPLSSPVPIASATP